MAKISIVIADDMESIHKDLRATLDSIGYEYEIAKDCYSAKDLILYMKDNDITLEADVLILDYSFGSVGMNGIELLPVIRKKHPNLPILMLSSFDNNDKKFSEARKKYNIDYLHKPVSGGELAFHMESIIDQMDEWDKLHKRITESEELMEYLDQENNDLKMDISLTQNQIVSQRLPMDMIELIQSIFPDVEFLAKSFRLMIKKTITITDWNYMFRGLKAIDWRIETDGIGNIRMERFESGKKYGYQNLWEYKLGTRKGTRIFVERRKGERPLIVLLDPDHSYEGLCL